ncbi:MAG: hypothetical protein FWD91_03620 [Treponema sp.]|nr:hypothetical protein [Treponema sp.]
MIAAALMRQDGETTSRFSRELQSFDYFNAPARVLAGESPVRIERRLARLQRRAATPQEHLSALKRYRALALLDGSYSVWYRNAAQKAAAAFPVSPDIAAVAAEALVLSNGGSFSGNFSDGFAEGRLLLGAYAGKMTAQPRFAYAVLALHILAGNFDDPAAAATVTAGGFEIPEQAIAAGAEYILVNDFLLRSVHGDISGATARLDSLVATAADEAGARRMAAEFFYDHNNPRRAAEILSRLAGSTGSDADIIRLADALALAGEMQGARTLWHLLASASESRESRANPARDELAGSGHSRLLYNLAASAATQQEQQQWLRQLFSYRAQRGQNPMDDSTGISSVIRYTRLMDTASGITTLLETATEAGIEQHPLLDLELLRRSLDTLPLARTTAEVWLLVNRHLGDEDIHRWAAWYFEHRRLYSEVQRLLDAAARSGMSGGWVASHRALALLRAGDIAAGESILRGAEQPDADADWRTFANLARIYESRRQIAAAQTAYETAAALVATATGERASPAERAAAAEVHLRLSRILQAQGRRQESRAALERGLALDPENLAVRRELRRLED